MAVRLNPDNPEQSPLGGQPSAAVSFDQPRISDEELTHWADACVNPAAEPVMIGSPQIMRLITEVRRLRLELTQQVAGNYRMVQRVNQAEGMLKARLQAEAEL